MIASGDTQGKIKVFDTRTAQSFITLDKHTGPVTGLVFSRPPGSRDAALFSCSKDGTVRAFDMLRYKNFRTYVPSSPTSLSCLAVDASGELIAAGGLEEPDIYIWNVQTKQLLDTLKSHSAPITAIAFSNDKTMLASASWDFTVKLWDIFGSKAAAETLNHTTEVMAIAFRPDSKELVASTSDGILNFWDVNGAYVAKCYRLHV